MEREHETLAGVSLPAGTRRRGCRGAREIWANGELRVATDERVLTMTRNARVSTDASRVLAVVWHGTRLVPSGVGGYRHLPSSLARQRLREIPRRRCEQMRFTRGKRDTNIRCEYYRLGCSSPALDKIGSWLRLDSSCGLYPASSKRPIQAHGSNRTLEGQMGI